GGGGIPGEVGDIAITTNAAITAGSTGISAAIGETATGSIAITANGSITADFDGIFADRVDERKDAVEVRGDRTIGRDGDEPAGPDRRHCQRGCYVRRWPGGHPDRWRRICAGYDCGRRDR